MLSRMDSTESVRIVRAKIKEIGFFTLFIPFLFVYLYMILG
jgi:hypothetical protein